MGTLKEKKAVITFIGKRLMGEKTALCFLHEGKEVFFSHTRHVRLGYEYEAIKTKESLSCMRLPPEIGESKLATEEKLDEWRVATRIAEQFVRRRLAARKLKDSPAIKRAADILRPLVKGIGYSAKEEFMTSILEELEREEIEAMKKDNRKRIERAIRGLERRRKREAK